LGRLVLVLLNALVLVLVRNKRQVVTILLAFSDRFAKSGLDLSDLPIHKKSDEGNQDLNLGKSIEITYISYRK
jgi:hypothetical protein